MQYLKPNKQRAQNSIALIYVVMGIDIALELSDYFRYNLLHKIALGHEISAETAQASDMIRGLLSGLYSIAFIASAVMFIQWFRRAYFNLHQKTIYLRQTEGWAAGCWFVPIICLFLPYQIMRDLYTETPQFLPKDESGAEVKLPTTILGFWWTLWLVSNVLGQILMLYIFNGKSLEELMNGTIVSLVMNIVRIALALVAIKVIRDYSRAETLLFYHNESFDAERDIENENGRSHEVALG